MSEYIKHSDIDTSKCHYQAPLKGNPIGAIFQCPGHWECLVGAPAAGITGSNLCKVFKCLREMTKNDELPDGIRKSHFYKCRIMITNATDKVHTSSDKKSEIKGEIKAPDNLDRLRNEIADTRLVFCFGDLASQAYDEIGPHKDGQIVIKTYHLSPKVFRLIDKMCEKEEKSAFSYDEKIKIFALYIYQRLKAGDVKKFADFRNFIEAEIKRAL